MRRRHALANQQETSETCVCGATVAFVDFVAMNAVGLPEEKEKKEKRKKKALNLDGFPVRERFWPFLVAE